MLAKKDSDAKIPGRQTPLANVEANFQLEEFRAEITRRDQDMLAVSAKMKTLEEQHIDYQRHIAVLKESLAAKEEHYNMLQADVKQSLTDSPKCPRLQLSSDFRSKSCAPGWRRRIG